MRRLRPDVVVTFGPDGAYGHPDHIAISQFTKAAIVAAADAAFVAGDASAAAPPHSVSKLYYLAWPESTWRARAAVMCHDGWSRDVTGPQNLVPVRGFAKGWNVGLSGFAA